MNAETVPDELIPQHPRSGVGILVERLKSAWSFLGNISQAKTYYLLRASRPLGTDIPGGISIIPIFPRVLFDDNPPEQPPEETK